MVTLVPKKKDDEAPLGTSDPSNYPKVEPRGAPPWCECLSKNMSVTLMSRFGGKKICSRCQKPEKKDFDPASALPRYPGVPFAAPGAARPLYPEGLLGRPTLPGLHTVALHTAEGEPVKPGAIRSLRAEPLTAFRPMSIECPQLVARRFHLMNLYAGPKPNALRFTPHGNSPVARWVIDEPPSLLPGEAVELFVMNTGSRAHPFAATLLGAAL